MTHTHRGWTISQGRWPEPAWSATGPNYDGWTDDGAWVSSSECAEAGTLEELIEEIDAWIAENEGICACGQPLDDNFECAVCRLSGEPTYSDYLIKTFKQIEHIFAKAAKP